ncbi:LRP16 family protein [Aspergillus terreus]|uniref:LRP16 family protein n=1 Tax=Aspergillus terreus TaxID=33178 RepID=A0A5M3Z8Q1_ASPTE|nr:hypothetical protein ATETN484_0011051700 [Aspergillus terreus]GFF19159.1 LRP16 family protein [Aspergillus terreus]
MPGRGRKYRPAKKPKDIWGWLRIPLTRVTKDTIMNNLLLGLHRDDLLRRDLRYKHNQRDVNRFITQQICNMPRPLRERYDKQPEEMLRRFRMAISKAKRDFTPPKRRSMSPVDRKEFALDELVHVYASGENPHLQRPQSFMLSAITRAPEEIARAARGWVPYSMLDFHALESFLVPLGYDPRSHEVYYHVPDAEGPESTVVVADVEHITAAVVLRQLHQLPVEFFLRPRTSDSIPVSEQSTIILSDCSSPEPLPPRSPELDSGSETLGQEQGSPDPEDQENMLSPTHMETVASLTVKGKWMHWPRPKYPANQVANDIISLAHTDITTLDVDCIVTGISEPRGQGGLDGAVHAAAGSRLLDACNDLGKCWVGEVQVTDAYNLPCKKVIHTVSPPYADGSADSKWLLRACYRRCLEIAIEGGMRTIAFPALSTGSKGFKSYEAATAALEEVRLFLEEPGHLLRFDKIIFCNVHQQDMEVYVAFTGQFFPLVPISVGSHASGVGSPTPASVPDSAVALTGPPEDSS